MKRIPASTLRLIIGTALLLTVIAGGTAQEVEDLQSLFPKLAETELLDLLENGELTRFISKEEKPLLVPGTDLRDKITSDLEAIDYTVGVEVVNIIPQGYPNLSAVDLTNMLLEMSTLEGLEYYSASRDKMRTLFVQSYAIDDRENRERVDDPAITEVPSAGSVMVFQEDKTFGKNVNRIRFDANETTIHTITENETTFTWNLVPIIRSGNMHLHVVIYRAEDFIIYYGNFGAHALRVNMFLNKIHNSFYNRLVALYGWFEAKLEE